MESDAELSVSNENRTNAPGEEQAASNALPKTGNIEPKPPAADDNATIEANEEALVVHAEDFTDIESKVKLLVKLALANLDGD
jgi:hypothetical protein